MSMPDRAYVAPHWFTIKKVSKLSEAGTCGLTGEDTQDIAIDDALGRGVERETVLHELIHAMWHQTGLDRKFKDSDEEEVAWSLAPRILALLKHNPDLVSYLVEE
jgi:hypothetical protein